MTRLVLRLHFDAAPGLGPGKIELLEHIARTGSISAAGRAMEMSYRRAWLLVDAMNRAFRAPVVATRLGGKRDGRAQVTELGHRVIALYRDIERSAREAADSPISELEHLLAEAGNTQRALRGAGGRVRAVLVKKVAG